MWFAKASGGGGSVLKDGTRVAHMTTTELPAPVTMAFALQTPEIQLMDSRRCWDVWIESCIFVLHVGG
ncbi:unnamed protein product [Echinostoma caproni]|uniref:Uncharacterized protein n=1 Tax=Echinostoma caproni TaxID=27848 RepID=A0A183AW78_9TREM|nr:unnamed protein product [Echinostoma caproni]